MKLTPMFLLLGKGFSSPYADDRSPAHVGHRSGPALLGRLRASCRVRGRDVRAGRAAAPIVQVRQLFHGGYCQRDYAGERAICPRIER